MSTELATVSKDHQALTPLVAKTCTDAQVQLESVLMLRTGPGPRRTRRLLLGLMLGSVAVMFLPWQQFITGDGRVTALRPQDRPQQVVSTIAGRIEEWYVAEGQQVKAGQPLVRLAEVKDEYFDPQLADRYSQQIDAKGGEISAKLAKAQSLSEQIENLRLGLTLKLRQARFKVSIDSAEVVAAELALQLAQRQFEGQKALYDQGLKSLTELEQRSLRLQESVAKLQGAQNKLNASRVELAAVVAEYGKDIAKAQADRSQTLAEVNEGRGSLTKLESNAAAFDVRTGYYVLRAPQDGYMVKALKQGLGEQISAQQPVATIMPLNPSQAVELYVSANDVPLIRRGDEVRLQFDGWPALQFAGWPSISVGTFGGRVQVIDYTSSSNGRYRILVVPDTTRDEAWPDPNILRQGSGVHGWAMLRTVRVGFEIWRQLNGFPPSLPGVPEAESMDAEKPAGAKK